MSGSFSITNLTPTDEMTNKLHFAVTEIILPVLAKVIKNNVHMSQLIQCQNVYLTSTYDLCFSKLPKHSNNQ